MAEDEAQDRKERIPEVTAFMERFNYFRRPFNLCNVGDDGWQWCPWYAGDEYVIEALNGKRSIGCLLNRSTSFIGFDLDLKKQGIKRAPGDVEAKGAQGREGSGQVETLAKDVESVTGEEVEGGTADGAAVAEWTGWRDLGIENEGAMDEVLRQSFEAAADYWSRDGQNGTEEREADGSGASGGNEEKEENGGTAVEAFERVKEGGRALCECFRVEPSLVVRSPHGGMHLYWCLSENRPWFKIKPVLDQLRKSWEKRCAGRVEGLELELLPSPTKPLRIPRTDRLLEAVGFEPMAVPVDGEAFWRGIKTYRFEDLIREEALIGRDEKVEGRARGDGKPGQPGRSVGRIGGKPKNKQEAEDRVMPFQNGETNQQLIQMVEAGKREGLGVEAVGEWIEAWVKRSQGLGYTGDLGRKPWELRGRIEDIYDKCRVPVAGASRFRNIWDEKNEMYARDVELEDEMFKRLEAVQPIAKQARRAALRFLGNLDVWRKIIDDAVADASGDIDRDVRINQSRGSYPLPSGLLEYWYSGYYKIWASIQACGIVTKDEGMGYVPDLGRPQYYRINR